jgi:protein-S-isoprenylcysteine O-methyltransferase Ste14
MASLRRSIVVSILFTVFGGPGIVLVYLPLWITHFRLPQAQPLWQLVLAYALIVAGLVPLLASMLRFIYAGRGTAMPAVPTERLVVSGFYRYVRNPMYVGVLTALAGEALLFSSRDIGIEALLVWLGTCLFIVFYEEPKLASTFPVEYPIYKRNVPRWLPRLTPWRGDAAGPGE